MIKLALLKDAVNQYKSASYSEGAINRLSKKLQKKIKETNYSDQEMEDYMILAIEVLCTTKQLYLLKNAGCFNFDKNNTYAVLQLTRSLLELKDELQLNKIDVQFLENISCIRTIYKIKAKQLKQLEQLIKEMTKICKLGSIQCSCLLTICVRVEDMIASYLQTPNRENVCNTELVQDISKLDSFSIEKIIDALGLIIVTNDDIYGKLQLPEVVFPDLVFSKRVEKILLVACRIRFLQELLLMNDTFAFMCESNGKRVILHSSGANERIMQDYRIGYMKYGLAFENFIRDNAISSDMSFSQLLQNLGDLVELEEVTNPHRYRLRINSYLIERLCAIDELSKDEQESIDFEISELNYIFKNIDKVNVYKSLTMLDYIKLRRVFIIFYEKHVKTVFSKYKNGLLDKKTYANSIIPYFPKKMFDILRPTFGDKIDDFFELIDYRVTKNRIIDLLYQPVLSNKNSIYVLSSVAYLSNIGRNLCVLLKRIDSNVNEDGATDALIENLDLAFDSANIPHKCNKSLAAVSDIDFTFLIDNTVYIAECKKNFHPTDMFESRSTIDALYKAERQLSRIINTLNTPHVKAEFLKLNFNVDNSEKITFVPLIITGNRIFSNTNEFTYPIRHFKELITYISEGSIYVGKRKIVLWKEERLTESDMDYYLSPKSPYSEVYQQSMVQFQKKIKLGKWELLVDDYSLNAIAVDNYCVKHWGIHALNEN